ncbi:hypothetical protein [Nostoc sp. MG11]|uniref:hypothetical protein n=1 Tax=Nostoc sp. MG11 TaxID=2721166 RepID=UPI001868AFBE|nr:hypothetical protein [Nostoc sp. MG11]
MSIKFLRQQIVLLWLTSRKSIGDYKRYRNNKIMMVMQFALTARINRNVHYYSYMQIRLGKT